MILQRDKIVDNTTNFYFLTDTIYRENYIDRKLTTMLSFQRKYTFWGPESPPKEV